MDDITRRGFLDRARKYALGGLAAAGTLQGLVPKKAWAQQASGDGTKPQNWLTLTDEPASSQGFRSSTRITTCGIGRATGTSSRISSRMPGRTMFVRRCSSSARRCTVPTDRKSSKVVGETEFVQGIAAMSASGRYGETRVAAGIVGTADLRLGDRIAPVLEAQIAASPQRFRGIRHCAAWADRSVVPNQPADLPQHVLLDPGFRQGYRLPRH
jgi:hypothetical protein